jgi:hypothetical protein
MLQLAGLTMHVLYSSNSADPCLQLSSLFFMLRQLAAHNVSGTAFSSELPAWRQRRCTYCAAHLSCVLSSQPLLYHYKQKQACKLFFFSYYLLNCVS